MTPQEAEIAAIRQMLQEAFFREIQLRAMLLTTQTALDKAREEISKLSPPAESPPPALET